MPRTAAGFVLVHAAAGREREVLRRLRKVAAVRDVTPVLGECDFIVKVEAPSLDSLGLAVRAGIQDLPGVEGAKVLPVGR